MNNISPVSFKKHIPVMDCSVKQRNNNENVKVTLSELDCTELQDFYDIDDLPRDKFQFCDHLMLNMSEKYKGNGYFETPSYEHDFVSALLYTDLHGLNTYEGKNPRFYVLEAPKTGIIGICQTHNDKDRVFVDFISSCNNGSYKYAGQNMLACLGKQAIKDNFKGVVINKPTKEAMNFYTKKCNCTPVKDSDNLIMDKKAIEKLIETTGKKTQSSINFIL